MLGPTSPPPWDSDYAAQVLAIAQQAQAANPDVPIMNAPGIVPMGAPGSLTPPPQAPPQAQAMQAPQMAPPMAPPMAAPAAAAPAPAALSLPGGGTWDKVQQMLPMLAAMSYGMNPRTAHMAPLMMQMGQMQQQQLGQRQLAEVRSNVAKLGEKGPDAVKKYLTEVVAAPNLRPDVSKAVGEQLSQVTDRMNASDAVAKLTTGDPKKFAEALPIIYASMPTEQANDLVKTFNRDNKYQIFQAGDSLVAVDPRTLEQHELRGLPKKFNAAEIGGTDVTQELTRMGIDPKESTPEDRQRASQNLLNRAQEDKAVGRASHERAVLGGAALQAKATEVAALTTAKEAARREQETLPREAAQQLADMKTSHALLSDIENAYNPRYSGPVAGPWGKVKSYTGWASPEEVTQRTRVIAAMNARLRTDSGLAVTANELDRKIEELPQINDPPETFMAKLKSTKEWVGKSYKDRHQFYTNPRSALPAELSDDTAKKSPIGVRTDKKGRLVE